MVDIWVISDTHFGHENIIRYSNRPFSSAEEMDEVMIQRWNSVVQPHHHVYHLGDVAFSQQRLNEVMPRLAGHKRLILGNHDNHAPIGDYAKYFDKILVWRLFKPVLLTHVPLHQGSIRKAKANVHGHIHERQSPPGPYINACVEHWNYTPVHLDQLIAIANKMPDLHIEEGEGW